MHLSSQTPNHNVELGLDLGIFQNSSICDQEWWPSLLGCDAPSSRKGGWVKITPQKCLFWMQHLIQMLVLLSKQLYFCDLAKLAPSEDPPMRLTPPRRVCYLKLPMLCGNTVTVCMVRLFLPKVLSEATHAKLPGCGRIFVLHMT